MSGTLVEPNKPSLSVVVCTRDRGDRIIPTIESLCANTHPNFEIVVIDQSAGYETEEALKTFESDPRLVYIRTWSKGLGRARNLGLSHARGELVAMTDDDCTVPAEWIEKLEACLNSHPSVGVIYCEVRAAEYDDTTGFIPIFYCNGERLITTVQGGCSGIGAGMAMRKAVVLAIGGFDEMMGAGSDYPSFEDGDLAVRALLNGYHVLQTGEIWVEHFGFRDWSGFRDLIRRDFVGIGAGHAKLVKCGQVRVFRVCMGDCWRLIAFPFVSHLLRLKKPPVLNRVTAYCAGFSRGLMTPVDRKAVVFRPKLDQDVDTPTEPRYSAARTLID